MNLPFSKLSIAYALYGAAIYLRRVHADNTTTVTLVTAKARVLPLKCITIPKAELLAALLMVILLISKSCPMCQRAYAQPLQHQMGLLPPSRTTPAPPFDKTGVDFAGPFVIRQGHTQKPIYVKTYACLFVCPSTKAIHIELCSSLSTNDFLATLRRFIANRGRTFHMFSDNGTNFVGAREEIREIQAMMTTNTSQNNIRWHHIPPRAPHFGGL